MDLTKTKNKSQLSLYLVVLGMWILFLHEVLKSLAVIEMLGAYSGYFILFIALLIEVKNGGLRFVDKNYRLWVVCIWVFSFFALIYGIVKSHELQFLSRDIWPYSYFACFLIAARTNRWSIIDKMIYRQFLIGLAVLVYIWLTVDITFQREAIARNSLSWDQPRIAWAGGLLFGWQYMLLTYRESQPTHRKIVTIVGIMLFLGFGIMMLKRQPLVEFAAIMTVKLLFDLDEKTIRTKPKRKLFIIFTIFTIFIVGAFFFKFGGLYEKNDQFSYIEKLVDRSTQTGSLLDTTIKDDRLSDTPLLIYNNASIFEILYGQGLGSVVDRSEGENNAVESGFFTIFMKGGIIYLIIWYFGLFRILWDTFMRKRRQNLLFRLLSAIFIIFSPVFCFFIMYPSSGYQMFWLGRSVSSGRASST